MYVLSVDLHSPMFEEPIIQWDENKKNFMYWLRFYNTHVFSLDEAERPAPHIVQYNALMDDYIEKKLFREKEDQRRDQEKRTGKMVETYHSR